MPRYLIERFFPNGLDAFLTTRPVEAITECLEDVGVIWLHSYVTEDRRHAFCLCEAASPEALRKAAHRLGLSVEIIHLVTVLHPRGYQQCPAELPGVHRPGSRHQAPHQTP
jgi:Protein of unknown function (DUF4242)